MMNIDNLCTRTGNELEEVLRIRHRILTEFQDISFDPGPHEYTLNGRILPSVSTIVHKFRKEENFNIIAKKYAKNNGFTAQYWLDQWKFNNLRAIITGTAVHEYGESCAWLFNGHPELITQENIPKYIPDKGWLIPTRPKEKSILKFWQELHPSLHFVLAETQVYSGKSDISATKTQFAGTFDLLMYYEDKQNPQNSGLVIMDYKTNKSLEDDYARTHKKKLLPPFQNYIDENLSIYTLQLSLYSLCLRGLGFDIKGCRIIWLKDDETYELIKVQDLSRDRQFKEIF